MKIDRKFCLGCHDDFYNGKNDLGVRECWNSKSAKVVKRFRIGWWTSCDRKGNFTEVTVFDCHKEPGSFAFYDKLPEHLLSEVKPLN